MVTQSGISAETAAQRRLFAPAYSALETARYTGMPESTVRQLFKPGPGFGGDPALQPGISYVQLAETAFIASMRKQGVPLNSLQEACLYVRRHFGEAFPFAHEHFITDGLDIFINALDNADHLVAVNHGGQRAWRELIVPKLRDRAKEFDYMHDLVLRWFPRGRGAWIIIDPAISFGRPTIHGTGVPTSVLADRHRLGETLAFIAEDFGLNREQVRDALWFEEEPIQA